MATNLRLDFISDVVCPWCIIGYRRLAQAIDELDLQHRIDIEWQPFELNPDMPVEGEILSDHIRRKYGLQSEDIERNTQQIIALGKELDFDFDFFDQMRIVNTRDAHILLDHAKNTGKQTDLKLRLFEAYFNEHKDISNREVLIHESQSSGLPSDDSLERLDNVMHRKQISLDEERWRKRGVTAVPTIVFGDAGALVGAQPVGVYKEALSGLFSSDDN